MTSVFLVPYGGLGNQLFQIAAASSFQENHNVEILANWGFARLQENGKLESDAFEFANRIEMDYAEQIGMFSRRILNLVLRLGASKKNRLTLELMEILFSPYFSVLLRKWVRLKIDKEFEPFKPAKGNLLVVGYFQSYRYFDLIKNDFLNVKLKYLAPNTEDYIEKINNKNVLVIHVRRGDYTFEEFGLLDENYYLRAMNVAKPESFDEVWIFSDEIDLVKQMRVFSSLHNAKFIEGKELSSAETMEIMRYGSAYIIANSSFSWWAAQLRYKRDAKVICPSPWFKNGFSPYGIHDPGWKVLDW